jgi:hypothetical protein
MARIAVRCEEVIISGSPRGGSSGKSHARTAPFPHRASCTLPPRASHKSVLEDWRPWLRVSAAGWGFAYIGGEPLWSYRLHAGQASQTAFAAMRQEGRPEVMQDVFRVAVVTRFCGRGCSIEKQAASWDIVGWPHDRLCSVAVDKPHHETFGTRRLRVTLDGTEAPRRPRRRRGSCRQP